MPEDSAPTPRQTLAMRMAERRRLRSDRAERLARLTSAFAEPRAEPCAESRAERPAEPPEPRPAPAPLAFPPVGAAPPTASERDAAAALEEFLRSLTQGLAGGAPAAPAAPGEVLPFPAREAPCDLERLEGVGPGLLWLLRRAGIAALADLAALEPEALATRLGPVGRLVPARAWIAAARGAAEA
jgi:predicted flap endonuclease-1-like 5' DNA nuclease